MADSAFLKLVGGSPRLSSWMGLQMVEGHEMSFAPGYVAIEIPVLGVREDDGSFGTEVKRNQHVFIAAAASVQVKGRHLIEIEPNPAFSAYGNVQPAYKIHPGGERQQLGFWFTARRDLNLVELGNCVSVYMPS